MGEFTRISNLVWHGKALTIIKPILNVIFVSGITFAILKKHYTAIAIPSTFTLKGVIDYFLAGEFIIPFAIFFFVWAISKFSGSLFEVINFKITERIRKKFDAFTFIKPEDTVDDAEMTPYMLVGVPKKQWTVKLYEAVRKKISDSKIDEIDIRVIALLFILNTNG